MTIEELNTFMLVSGKFTNGNFSEIAARKKAEIVLSELYSDYIY